MTEPSWDAFSEHIRELFGFSPQEWAAIDALAQAEKRLRDLDHARMMAHIGHVADTMPDRLRAEGYDVPDGLRFEVRP